MRGGPTRRSFVSGGFKNLEVISFLNLWRYSLLRGILIDMKKSGFLFTAPLILSFVFSSVICCCPPGHAEAGISHEEITQSIQASSHDSHGDSDDSQGHHSTADHKCECPKLQSTLAKNFNILKAADIVLHSFSRQIILDKIFLAFVPDSHNALIGPSPPQFSSSSIPLYIKNPALRI